MRWLKRAARDPFWFIATRPFYLIYYFFRWLLLSKNLNSDGYVVRKSSSGKDLYQHREVAEEILGRRLKPSEVVHHINGKRYDNRPANLCVMESFEHDRYHKWYDWVRAQGTYPRRETSLKKLRETFRGTLLSDVSKRNRAG